MFITFIIFALLFCGASVYCFFKANYCACTKEGDCDNPVTHYWLSAITSAFASLALCCIALHSQYGTLLWLTLMISCFLGGYISAKTNKIKRKKNTKPTSALLTNELN